MMTGSCLCILILLVQIHGYFGDKDPLCVGILLEATQHGLSKYLAFLTAILEHAFEEILNGTDLLQEYSLKLIPKDTQVMQLLFAIKYQFSLNVIFPDITPSLPPFPFAPRNVFIILIILALLITTIFILPVYIPSELSKFSSTDFER